nr:MAG TPA: hypothetical protein [Caudoviricetes sp.]
MHFYIAHTFYLSYNHFVNKKIRYWQYRIRDLSTRMIDI